MSAKTLRGLSITLAALLFAGCAAKPTDQSLPSDTLARRPAKTRPKTSTAIGTPSPPTVTGVDGYSASFVTGDYAAYPSMAHFIDRMVNTHGFGREYLNGLFSRAQRKQWTIDYMNREAPSVKPRPGAWSRYRAKFLTEQHISKGVAFWRRHATALDGASDRFGVPPEYVVAIIGVETIYGSNVGKDRTLDALTTLAFDYPRRAEYFSEELENFLLMTRAEHIDPATPVGSFAGAMGLAQFMPGSFLKWAVDFDGDGRKDLWQPVDAIGSVANYFSQHGWEPGAGVVTPASVADTRAETLESGFDTQYSLAYLADHGVRPMRTVRKVSEPLRLLRLSTNDGDEYWLGHHNFYVITRYNHSTHYAMAVHQLAQAIKDRYWGSVAASLN